MEVVIPRIVDSALALERIRLEHGAELTVHEPDLDSLLFSVTGSGVLSLPGAATQVERGSAALVLAGEEATIVAGGGGLELICATVGPSADRHAPLGPREVVVGLDGASSDQATGLRSFQILFGPHNGSTRATLFAGYLPPGRAPWHYRTTCTTRSCGCPRGRGCSTESAPRKHSAPTRPSGCDRVRCTSSRTRAPIAS